ncbi:MAG: hypothetical protein CSA42_08630, partial [Gammaproteobacteria bacterium]
MAFKQQSITLNAAILVGTVFFSGCSSLTFENTSAVEALAMCQDNAQSFELKKNIRTQFGFRKIAADTYSPKTDLRVFGHAVSVIDLNDKRNRFYLSGEPKEFAHHVKPFVESISCEQKKFCEAVINKKQKIRIYKTRNRKLKRTSILECNYPQENLM